MSRQALWQWIGVLAISLVVYFHFTTGFGIGEMLWRVLSCVLLGGVFAALPRLVGWRRWPEVFLVTAAMFGMLTPVSEAAYQNYLARHDRGPTTADLTAGHKVPAFPPTGSSAEATVPVSDVDDRLVASFSTVQSTGEAMQALVQQHRQTMDTGALVASTQGLAAFRRAREGMADAYTARVTAFARGAGDTVSALHDWPRMRRTVAEAAFESGDAPTEGLLAALSATQDRALADASAFADIAEVALAVNAPLTVASKDPAAVQKRAFAKIYLDAFAVDSSLAEELYALAIRSRAIAVGRTRRVRTVDLP
jgi:hypothetical protein